MMKSVVGVSGGAEERGREAYCARAHPTSSSGVALCFENLAYGFPVRCVDFYPACSLLMIELELLRSRTPTEEHVLDVALGFLDVGAQIDGP